MKIQWTDVVKLVTDFIEVYKHFFNYFLQSKILGVNPIKSVIYPLTLNTCMNIWLL